MTLTDEQYAEAIAAVKRGDQTLGTIHVYRWCDGSTACAVESEPHGHWRGGYTVDGTEVLRRLLAENERLRETLQALVDEKLVCNVREGDGSYIDVSAWCRAVLNGEKP